MSSRVVSARLQFALVDGSAKSFTLVCAYAPTYVASRTVKEKFFDDVQSVLYDFPPSDCCIVLGDFNTHVGSGQRGDEWSDVRGTHGYNTINASGAELLSFAAFNQLCICNIWFPKRNIFKQTWQHPGTLQWHCIDFILVRQDDHHLCTDVAVIWSAESGSDHRLL